MPVLGITRVANVTGLDVVGIPVVMVCRPNSRSIAVSQGKGHDLAAAKASGLMESFEQYHAERITQPLKLASYNELRFSHEVADPASLLWTSATSFHDELRLLWIEADDVIQNSRVWVPFETVHADFTYTRRAGTGAFTSGTNGLASGNNLLEAVTHGICEVVERHCSSLWKELPMQDREAIRLDLSSVADPTCLGFMERYQQADIQVAVWEMTSGFGIPAFVCSIASGAEQPRGLPELHGGMGCHPSREVALARALSEAAQSRLTFIAGSRDDLMRRRYGPTPNPELVDAVLSPPELLQRSLSETPTCEAETHADDAAWLLRRLRSAGVERVLVVDLSRPELGLSVVKVIIPGLRGTNWVSAYLEKPIEDALRNLRTDP